MSPSPGDEASSQDSKNLGGLASVFKGLAGAAKLTKSAPTPAQPTGHSVTAQLAEHLSSVPASTTSVPRQHLDSFEKLKSGPMPERIQAARVLRSVVADYSLNSVLDIWYAAKDLIEPTNASTARIAGWELLAQCVKHPLSTDLERKEYFQTISAPANPEDFHLQLAALEDLTKHGRDVCGFDYDIFPLLSTWLDFIFDSVRAARSAAKKQGPRGKGKGVATGEEKNFNDLFTFVTDVIKFNFVVADDEAVETIINSLINICTYTSVEEDMRACISVIDSIVTFGVLPRDKLQSCVVVLASIHCLVEELENEAWHTIGILCRSHNGQAVVRTLLEVMSNVSTTAEKRKEGVREVRGVLSVLCKLVWKSSEKGYPSVPYTLLVDGLAKVVDTTTSWKVHRDIMRLVNALFCNAEAGGAINNMLLDEDWTALLDIAVKSSAGVVTYISKTDAPSILAMASDDLDSPETSIARELYALISRLEAILAEHQNILIQRQDCITFFVKVHLVVPNSAAMLILKYFQEFRCCFPSDAQWVSNLNLVMDSFFADRKRSTDVRSQALRTITEVYDMVELVNEQVEDGFMSHLVKRLLGVMSEEQDVLLLQDIVSFVSTVAISSSFPSFCHITDTLHGIVQTENPPSSATLASSPDAAASTHALKPVKNQTPPNVVAKGLVRMFLDVMNSDATKANRLFRSIVSIASSSSTDTDARLTAMQLLFRLRADWANRVFVTRDVESDNLAAALYRTEASLARKLAEDAAMQSRLSRGEGVGASRLSRGLSFSHGQDRGPSLRSTNSAKTSICLNQPLWMSADADALPITPSEDASPVLSSSAPDDASGAPDNTADSAEKQETVLPMRLWLSVILTLLQEGCDWEIYSFILVHLPSQLSNHGIFKMAVPELQGLRSMVCDQIRLNSFPEPPSSCGLRRADVAICLFHTLTMLLSYHRHFQRPEEDEIVRTFVHGIATWERSAKCCIHALTICCHELPTSSSKALVTMLQRMSQIITQPYVAMHILEFLACLSRLPSLYVNFREDEYRIVFGICFRYLQYVRGKKETLRTTSVFESPNNPGVHDPTSRPNASDDLPQYVYTLAYHVILFWFLALKLPDRANHVSWIAKNLFTDVDGSQVSDEQAQITIDFMQRVTFADVDESAADPLFTPDRFGEIIKKRWLVGNSIVTIEQATTTGWAQITKRQPSGTSSFTIRELFRPPPAHQRPMSESTGSSINKVLPNHLLVQLLASMPQGVDPGRPVPLPDDEAVNRSIRLFDHSSTVDGHKVGVVYIGENQTQEAEILANVSGSGDYVEFLSGLGTLTRLKGATFNTQGLDRQFDTDGQFTFCWRDRVTELVFHVTTQMPTNLDNDPQCTLKKRHIGNDFVNIIFNNSGLPFKFNTFPSEFNYVNIVITPESRFSFVAHRQRSPEDLRESFYKVQLMSKPGFPEISPAADTKIISLKALPDFIRLLALNASVFALVWANRKGGEHISSWRNRLREINRLRERYGPKYQMYGPSPSPPGTAGPGQQLDLVKPVRDSFSSIRRSSVATFFTSSSAEPTSHRSSMLSTAPTDNTEIMAVNGVDLLVDSVDFSRWAK
ncbi:hypothetical protein F4780DRAFT_776535 [Xylariomycetidae sp. FL0641]|nr:hypothetical protein F4780DRAFT_776535 [Xylariomycetidae sp. FL0641]